MKLYTVLLLDHDEREVDRLNEVEGRKKAISRAKDALTDSYAQSRLETTHERMDTSHVQVLGPDGEVIFERYHPESHIETRLKIRKDVCYGEFLDLNRMGTTGLVNYVLGGLKGIAPRHLMLRLDEVAALLDADKLPVFRRAVAAGFLQRGGDPRVLGRAGRQLFAAA